MKDTILEAISAVFDVLERELDSILADISHPE